MIVFYYTSTGNCLWVAKKIGGELISIPQIVNNEDLTYQDSVVGLVYPIYGFDVPRMVNRFLEKVTINADYTFVIGTYGNNCGAAAHNVQTVLAEKYNLRFDYSTTLLMVDNYLPGFAIEDQIAKIPEKKTDENLAKIISDIKGRMKNNAQTTAMWRMTAAAVKAGKLLSNKGYYYDNGDCDMCGICSRVCPAGNITIEDKVVFGDRCEGCLGCIHWCPQNALHLKNEKSGARWQNPEISLDEIIESNEQ